MENSRRRQRGENDETLGTRKHDKEIAQEREIVTFFKRYFVFFLFLVLSFASRFDCVWYICIFICFLVVFELSVLVCVSSCNGKRKEKTQQQGKLLRSHLFMLVKISGYYMFMHKI